MLTTAILILIPLTALAENEWKKSNSLNGVEVFRRKVDGYILDEVKVLYTINASLENCYKILKDVNNHCQWIAGISRSEIVKKINDSNQIVYYRLNLPFPLSDRYAITKLHHQVDWNNGIISTSIINIPSSERDDDSLEFKPDDLPEVKRAYYHFTLKQINTNQTNVMFIAHGDLELPGHLINKLIFLQPYLTMKKLGKLSEKL